MCGSKPPTKWTMFDIGSLTPKDNKFELIKKINTSRGVKYWCPAGIYMCG